MTNSIRKQMDERGFSLVELMVVMVILTIGLLPLALIQTRAQQDVFEAGQFSEAVKVAELQMETAKSLGFGNTVADSGLVDNSYTWRRTIVTVNPGLEQVAVTVGWNEKGNNRSIMVMNRISRR